MKQKKIFYIIIICITLLAIKRYGYKILGREKFVKEVKSCEEYAFGGGAMIRSYIVLEFSKEDGLCYYENAFHIVTTDKQSFKYTKKDNYIYIKGDKGSYLVTEYDTLKRIGDTLRGSWGTKFIKE